MLSAQVASRVYQLSSWVAQNAQGFRAMSLALSLGVAVLAALLGPGVALANPTGGGGSGGS